MPATERRWTATEVRRLIAESPMYGPRYELIDGELLVTPAPAPRHQVALAWLYDRLAPYVKRERLGALLWSPADIELAPEQITQPDLFVVPQLLRDVPREWSQLTTLVLAIEALSPGTEANDRIKKRAHYMSEGVPDYWIVDLDGRCIEGWQPGDARPEMNTITLTWHPAAATAPLVIELAELWEITAQ